MRDLTAKMSHQIFKGKEPFAEADIIEQNKNFVQSGVEENPGPPENDRFFRILI